MCELFSIVMYRDFLLSLDVIYVFISLCVFFFFKQKTAYEMRISDWSSDVCSSDLASILSALLHLGVIVALVIGLPVLHDPMVDFRSVPVEMVMLPEASTDAPEIGRAHV